MIRKRALFVSNFLSGTGLNRVYADDLSDRLEAIGWSIVRTSMRQNRGLRLADMAITALRRSRDYDVGHVDVFSGAAFVWAETTAILLRAMRKPFVLTLRGGNLPEFARTHRARTTRLLSRASAVTVPSAYLETEMRPFRSDLVVLPNAIETGLYRYRLRTQVAPRLVWLRAFHSIYRPVTAIDTLARVRVRYPSATLRMVGPDKRDGSLAMVRRRVEELSLESHVEIVPGVPKSDVPNQLATGDIFLNTTSVDNHPVSVLEALATGLCVVSTRVGGLEHLLTDGKTALLVDRPDADLLAAAVIRVLDMPAVADTLSRNAGDLAARHDWGRLLERWNYLLAGYVS